LVKGQGVERFLKAKKHRPVRVLPRGEFRRIMRRKVILLSPKTFLFIAAGAAVFGLLATVNCRAQDAKAEPRVAGDPQIAAALKQVSKERIQANVEKLVSFYTRSTVSAGNQELLNAGRGIDAARLWIVAEFERYSRACGGCLDVETYKFVQPQGERIPSPTEISDIYAVMNGTDAVNSKRIVLVTGHYDSRNSDPLDTKDYAPGANDDASGTAVSLECARVLSQVKFPGTIIFLAVAGEEQGLYGSQHFAQMAKEHGWNIEAVLNNDIVGGDKNAAQVASIVRVFSEGLPAAATEQETRRIRALGEESDSGSRQLARFIAEMGRTYDTGVKPMLVFRPDRYLRGGDHTSFNQQGFAAVRFTEFREDFNHQHQTPRTENGVEYGDHSKFVDYDYVTRVARLNAATLASLAAGPGPPANVHLLTKNLENDSTLMWDAPPGGLATEYEVLWRATTSPEWEHVLKVGNVTRTTVQISKDEVIFAVRAVDKSGHRSLAVVPTPER
jgi:Peptidase family M28